MNANEVIANKALEILGYAKGSYAHLHPNAHVNMSQSTNDVYPTALKIAAYLGAQDLVEAMQRLRDAFEAKALEFADVLKMGRTQFQDAVPMTLGQEFNTYGIMLKEDQQRLQAAAALMLEINLGGTAIGTGIASRFCRPRLSAVEGMRIKTWTDLYVKAETSAILDRAERPQ